jgi:hypothetical protein
MDGRELPVENDRGNRSTEKRSWIDLPWGFFLVLAAIVIVATMYMVTMGSMPQIPPETAVGAMSGALALIGTLVGTYFGIKAGLDGQEKLKQTRARDTGISGERTPVSTERDSDRRSARRPAEEVSTERDGDRRREGQAAEEQRRGARDQRERRREEPEERQGWEGVGV